MGGKDIGYGHIYRCLSLAKAIVKQAITFDVVFIVNDEIKSIVRDSGFKYEVSNDFSDDYEIMTKIGIDFVILDSYLADDFYLKNIRKNLKLMLFDDNNDIYDSEIPDVILNGNIHAKKMDYKPNNSTIFLLGTKYLVMREDYWDDVSTEIIKKSGVLITTGGSDSYNISIKILKELSGTDYIKKVVVGPGYSDETINEINRLKDNKTTIIMKPNGLKDYINSSEFVITASGSTVYEVISQKSIPIIFSLAENQNIAYKHFQESGIKTIGIFPDIHYNEIIHALKQTDKIDNAKLYNLIDGKGALRVAHQIIQMLC
jgi:spore coat polysaccharide biosynthesis predicted glycosyltransferase SpsG